MYNICQNSKENITILGTFAASGKILPPAVVYPYERIPRDIAINVNKEWSIGKSKNGWMTCKVFYGYIGNSLLPFLQKNGTKFPVLLLVDGHRSHISGEVSKFCMENGIMLYALHPNSTHILQPADVSVFRPLKNNWKSVVQNYKLKTGTRMLTRSLFAPLLEDAFKAATPSTIANGCRKCGLYPFDADAIDYSRCINDRTRHEIADKPTKMGSEHLLYMESLMRRGRAEAFRAIKKDDDWTGDESAKELFYVWRKLKNRIIPECSEDVVENEENEQNEENVKTQDLNRNISESERYEGDEETQELNRNITESDKNEENVHTQNLNKHFTKSRDDEENLDKQELNRNVTESEENKENVETLNLKNYIPESVGFNDQIGSPGDQNQYEPENSQVARKVPLPNNISPAFANAVVWPTESPIKHGKKRNKVVYPDAISSPSWISYWDDKDKEKKDKEEKKLMRAEKRKLKEQKTKKSQNSKQRRSAVFSDTSDSEDDIVLSEIAEIGIKKKNLFQNVVREVGNNYNVGMYVIVQYEGEYFPGVIKNSEHDYKEVSVMVLSTPSTFKWPEKPDTIWYKNEDIIEKINPPRPVNQRGSYKVTEMAKYLPEKY